MNALRNRVQLIGNLGNDPEVREFDGGKKMVKFSVATNEVYKNSKGEKVKETQWHNLVAWGRVATLAEKYLKKGKEVAIDGKLTTRSYEDRDGNKKYVSEIIVNDILMLSPKKQKSEQS